jgi:nitroreductase
MAVATSVKIAAPDHPILELIANRWSPRAWADRPVEPEKIRSVLEAARWAPSSFNEQPWNLLIATKDQPEEFSKLAECLSAGNAWARKAPVLMLSVAFLNFSNSGKPNRHAWHDVGLAVENLVLQALSLDLYTHQMAGFDADKARQTFHIPDTHAPVAMIALGYAGDPDSLPEELRKRELSPRQRKPLREFVFSGEWGHASGLL